MPNTDTESHITTSTTVYISNVSEDVWPFICEMASKKEQKYEIDENAFLSDRDLLTCAGEDNLIIILPRPLNPDFLAYYLDLFGNKNLQVLVPKTHTGEICSDIMRDAGVMTKLVKAANGAKQLSMKCYSTSLQFLKLVNKLRLKGVHITTPESPEDADSWTVNFFGSKAGIRQLAQQSSAVEPDFKMAPGVISMGIDDTAQIAAKKYVKEKGVVLKTNKGHSGAGMFIFRPGDLSENYHECEKQILTHLKEQPYWDKFPIIVEELVDINVTIGGGSPNAEFKVSRTGKVELLYFCGMRVTKDGVFKGVEIHKDVLSDKVIAQITDTGFFIGEQYATQGYRGYYDVDLVAAKNGTLYITESNVRRTGGTHVYQAAKALFGRDFMYQVYTLSNNLYQLPGKKKVTFAQLQKLLAPVLFTKKNKEGVVLAAANLLQNHQIAYIVFGKNKKRAIELETEMEKLLKKHLR